MKKLICIFSGMLLSILLVTSVFASGRYEETDRGTVYITDETKQIPYLTFDEISLYNAGKGQILRSTPNTAPLICGACNTQPEGLLTMA